MEALPLSDPSGVGFAEVWALYEVSFPESERRSWGQQVLAMREPAYVCLGLRGTAAGYRGVREAAMCGKEDVGSASGLAGVDDAGGERGGDGVLGLLFLWEKPDYVFVEHLAIHPACRGLGLGHRAMELLHAYAGDRPVILEIEPVVDEVTARRCRFYRDCGYHCLPYRHEQPPFHRGGAPVSLVLMSYPSVLDAAVVAAFECYYLDCVMRYRDV